jgi:hypothetical protein
MEHSCSGEAYGRLANQKFPEICMQFEGLLPCSQQPSALHYLEPAESTVIRPLRSILLLFCHPCLNATNNLF